MACRIGGPDGKSDQAILNGSLLIRPAAVSSASAPVPAWSPMRRVTLDKAAALTASSFLAALLLDDDPEEQAAASRPVARKQAATLAERKRAGRLVVISFLPW